MVLSISSISVAVLSLRFVFWRHVIVAFVVLVGLLTPNAGTILNVVHMVLVWSLRGTLLDPKESEWLKDIVVMSSIRLKLESGPSGHVNDVDVDERRDDISAMVVDNDVLMSTVICATNRTCPDPSYCSSVH